MISMTRAEKTQVRLGGLASELIVLVAKNPAEANAYALHKKIERAHGEQFASAPDVNRALNELAEHGFLTKVTEEQGTRPRHFYQPNFKTGLILGFLLPQSEWESVGLAPKPEAVRKAS